MQLVHNGLCDIHGFSRSFNSNYMIVKTESGLMNNTNNYCGKWVSAKETLNGVYQGNASPINSHFRRAPQLVRETRDLPDINLSGRFTT